MTPTPEQVVQWAREAGIPSLDLCSAAEQKKILNFVTRAMAEQAEADAKLCEDADHMGSVNLKLMKNRNAAAIRANAPKVTT